MPSSDALIPREVLFGNPARFDPKLSPDGTRMAWIAPDERNVLQLWVADAEGRHERPVSRDQRRGIREYIWSPDGSRLLYLQDKDGNENYNLFSVDPDSLATTNLTPFDNVQAHIVDASPDHPEHILIMLNKENPELHDVYRLELATGALELVVKNPGAALGYTVDAQQRVRAATSALPDGGTRIDVRTDDDSSWRLLLEAGPDETVRVLGVTPDGWGLYMISNLNSDTTEVVVQPFDGSPPVIVVHADDTDVEDVMIHPTRRHVEAIITKPGRNAWTTVDNKVLEDICDISELDHGDFMVTSRDADDKTWLVAFTSDRGPVAYWRWDRVSRRGRRLFVHQPRLAGLELAEMEPISFTARDGLTIHGYLTRPLHPAKNPPPMVLFVHGGPWHRDTWGFNPVAQWLANRGYACLQLNYRGSTGYGKRFLSAGFKQWGRAMHDDLLDGLRWAVEQGIADPEKIAIFGGSYGGYAALAGVTFTPEVFACAVDIVGPSNLHTFVRSIPPYWRSMRGLLDVRVGNIDDPEDAELLKKVSPLFSAHRIVRPLLIAQGANDPRVPRAESEQIVEEIKRRKGSVTYVLYPDEGHGFARHPNNLDFYARAEQFLAKHLGGRFEPIAHAEHREPGSTALVREIVRGEERASSESGEVSA